MSKTNNITYATLFGTNPSVEYGESAVDTQYVGMELGLDTIASNVVDTFSVNGNVVTISSSTLSVVLPNAAAIGVDDESGNWIINGAVTDKRAKGIDGTVSFDELTAEQRRSLTFTSATVTTLNPWENASATITDTGYVSHGRQDIGDCPDNGLLSSEPSVAQAQYDSYVAGFGDFHVQPSSLLNRAEYSGVFDEHFATDLDGTRRDLSHPTLGAYQYIEAEEEPEP